MAVDPSSMTMPPPPMTCSPGVIRVACIITRPVNVIRPIANFDGHRPGIAIVRSTVIRPIIIRTVTRIRGIIPLARCHPKHGANEPAQQQRAFDYHVHHTWYSDSKDDLRGLVDSGGRKFMA